MKNHGEVLVVQLSARPKVTLSLRIWRFLVQSVTVPVGHSSDVKHRPKTKISVLADIQSVFLCISEYQYCYVHYVNWGIQRKHTVYT